MFEHRGREVSKLKGPELYLVLYSHGSKRRASARRPPQVDYVLLFGPTEKGKIWHAIFPSF